MKLIFTSPLVICLLLTMSNCGNTTHAPATTAATPITQAAPLSAETMQYWYQGKAELSTFDVVQDRYDETRQATQVNIFVTEDLSKSKQVKLDDPASAGTDRVPVLKLNSIRRFETGIYDYSIMQSLFSPMDGSAALKSTCTVQDWCGQVFFQTNLTPDGFRTRGFSYFEGEGDADMKLPVVLMEDELWTRIRLNPMAIPTGKQKIIPSCLYSRLRHKAYTALDADIQLEKGEKESTLSLLYSGTPRSLKIRFESAFPYKILGWEEMDNARLSSKGTLKKVRMGAYWGEHDNASSGLRDSLGLR